MTAAHALIGILLGALGGAAHLAVTRWRASLALSRGFWPALVTLPLALAGPAAAVLAAAAIAPPAAWLTPVGLLAARTLLLWRLREPADKPRAAPASGEAGAREEGP